MAIIKIYPRKSKPANKKPGWQKAAAEYAAWESKVAAMSSGIKVPQRLKVAPKAPLKPAPIESSGPLKAKYVLGSGTKPVHRPEIMYKENPEMLEREIAARARKFNVAPMYNKGGDAYVTEEQLQDVLSSNKRRP